MIKRNLLTLVLTAIFSIVIAFLIYKKIVYPTIIPVEKDGLTYIFADWAAIISANICEQKGINVYLENPCDIKNRKHVYGEILLHLPLMESKIFYQFYQFYIPIILNVIFLFIIISFFNQTKTYKNYSLALFIISLPVILVIERANLDIFILILMYLISKYKNLFLNHFIIIFSTLVKFYPICFGAIFLFQRNIKKIFLNLLILILFLILFIIHQYENLTAILNNSLQFSGTGVYQFSIMGLIESIPNIQVIINNYNINWLIYFFIIFLLISPLIFFGKKIFQDSEKETYLLNIFDLNNFENRLYICSTFVIIFCYFAVQNYNYREIFLLGLVPWILKNESVNKNFLDIFFYIILFKFLISTILTYLIMSKVNVNFNYFTNLTKHIIDFYVVSILSIILFLNLKNLFKKHFLLKKN